MAHEPVGARKEGNASRAKGLWVKTVRSLEQMRTDFEPGDQTVQDRTKHEANLRDDPVCVPSLKGSPSKGRLVVKGLHFQPDRGNPAVRDDSGGTRKRDPGSD